MNNKKLRHAVAELLKSVTLNGAPLFDSESVYPCHLSRINEGDNLPVACVYVDGGEVESLHSIDQDEVTLIIQVYDIAKLNIDDRLDEFLISIRQAIKANHTLGGSVDELLLNKYEYDKDDSSSLGTLTLILNATFET
ncbi:phage tail terminator protein [Pseudoalteromonas umbrosa]|uniref:phage tail terminator protein n=1 Tax=Pseudoalteromonas umbrosa TaxID=3048489 RepID=UPI0024C2F012|nr:phage tail terminator protein [Pseudoalteromonas sp. B95]MDK1289782.1 phage tail terminator protein [Pseudoalteromonas sp. B95]